MLATYEGEKSFTNGVNYGENDLVDNLKNLLTEHSQGIPLTALEDVYRRKFSKSLLIELIKLSVPDVLENFVLITLEDQKNGLFDNIIALKDQSNNNQEQSLQEITASGIVSSEFRYAPNPFTSDNDKTFLAFVSNIDKYSYYIHIQPECYMQYMEELTEALDIYYSDPISDKLLVKDVVIGLACVSQFEGIYHRVHVKENHPFKCVITYVDLGLIVEVEKSSVQFKHLLNYFATLPCMAVACCLAGVEFKLNNYQMPLGNYQKLNDLCQSGPFFVEPYDQVNGVLNVKIFDRDHRCLNDIVIKEGLAFQTAMPPSIGIKNDEYRQETQHLPPPVNSKHKSFNHIQQTDRTPKTADPNSNHALNDYDMDEYTKTAALSQQAVTTRTPAPNAYNGYIIEGVSETLNSKQPKHNTTFARSPAFNPTIQSGARSNGKRSTNEKNRSSTSQRNQRDGRHNENLTHHTVTISRDMPGVRIFSSALSFLSPNNGSNQRHVSSLVKSITYQKKDEFANWMCSWLIEHSLWTSDMYRNALLKYIGRIYKQGAHMYRRFAQLKDDMQKIDELDLLYKLIENTKQRHDAQMSFDKWKDNSRINRRVEDLKLIFEFHGNYTSSNHPFNITPSGLHEIIDRRTIKSYFDLGCGDGIITAGIGAYLGLNKENIFGGDVYEGQSRDITFIKLNESQSTIALPDNHVDLVTSFVTFHHLSQLKETLTELARIVRPGGYLILREHDCTSKQSLSTKYLHFVHAIMMIAGVGEFANTSSNHTSKNQHISNDYENDIDSWKKQKSSIIEYTKLIHYRTCDEWQQELGSVGFHLHATLYYGANGSDNPQKLFYAVYQLDKK